MGRWPQHRLSPGSPHVVAMAGGEPHLYVLQSQVFPAASSVDGKQRASPRHQAEDAHDGPHGGVDADTDVVAGGQRVGMAGVCARACVRVCVRAHREAHITQHLPL